MVACGLSSSGKLMLIHTLNRFETIQKDHIIVNGHEVHAPGVDVNMLCSGIDLVFQQFNLFPYLTILQSCVLAPVQLECMLPQEVKDFVMSLLERVGLLHKAGAYPGELSGG